METDNLAKAMQEKFQISLVKVSTGRNSGNRLGERSHLNPKDTHIPKATRMRRCRLLGIRARFY